MPLIGKNRWRLQELPWTFVEITLETFVDCFRRICAEAIGNVVTTCDIKNSAWHCLFNDKCVYIFAHCKTKICELEHQPIQQCTSNWSKLKSTYQNVQIEQKNHNCQNSNLQIHKPQINGCTNIYKKVLSEYPFLRYFWAFWTTVWQCIEHWV